MRLIQSSTLLFSLLICFACSDSGKGEQANNSSQKGQSELRIYSSEIKTLSFEDDGCGEKLCTHIRISYPEFTNNGDLAKELNAEIKKRIKSEISNYVMDKTEGGSISSLADSFISSYRSFTKEFPEVTSKWYIELVLRITYQNSDFISIEINSKTYTGGAHENGEVKYVNFSSYGELVNDLNFFFYNKEQLTDITEKRFREVKKIDQEQSLADAGYIFDNNQFKLSNQFGFNPEGLIMYYNNYEIGSYADGYTELVIPFNLLGANYRFN